MHFNLQILVKNKKKSDMIDILNKLYATLSLGLFIIMIIWHSYS